MHGMHFFFYEEKSFVDKDGNIFRLSKDFKDFLECALLSKMTTKQWKAFIIFFEAIYFLSFCFLFHEAKQPLHSQRISQEDKDKNDRLLLKISCQCD